MSVELAEVPHKLYIHIYIVFNFHFRSIYIIFHLYCIYFIDSELCLCSQISYMVSHHVQNGKTPLHYAAWRLDLKLCRFLVEAGADARKVDNEGRTPAAFAKEAYASVTLQTYLKDAEQERAEVEMAFKRARLEHEEEN